MGFVKGGLVVACGALLTVQRRHVHGEGERAPAPQPFDQSWYAAATIAHSSRQSR
jgi:hypothetical protein